MTFNQGDIIKFNFDPTLGHEQAGYRPAVVISRRLFHEKTGQLIVCPVTTKSRPYPTRVPISDECETQGFIICDHVKTIDVKARSPVFIERISEKELDNALAIIYAQIEKD
jgi:mRNA interferase MazF